MNSENPQTDHKDAANPQPQSETTSQQFSELLKLFSDYLDRLPGIVSTFFSTYQRPLISVGLVFAALLGVKLALAFLDALDDIPLLAPLLELVGLGYAIWFVYRYLLSASSRQELNERVNALKEYIIGKSKES